MNAVSVAALCGLLLVQPPEPTDSSKKKKGSKGTAVVSAGLIDYKGKKITIDKLRDFAKKIPSQQLQNKKAYAKLVGSAIRIEGTLRKTADESWEVAFQDRDDKPPVTVSIDPKRFGTEKKVREGMNVTVVGIVREGAIEGYAWELHLPGLKWEYALQKPAAVVAGTAQTYVLKGRVANTGAQPLRRVLVVARLYQVSSPNDTTTEFLLRDLAIGETRDFTVEFPTYNFQAIGATSVPKVQMAVVDYEL